MHFHWLQYKAVKVLLSTLSASANKVTLKYSGLDISDMYDLVRWWSIEVGEMYKIGNNRSKFKASTFGHNASTFKKKNCC